MENGLGRIVCHFYSERYHINAYPAIKKYLLQFKEDLEPKNVVADTRGRKPVHKWFEIQTILLITKRDQL